MPSLALALNLGSGPVVAQDYAAELAKQLQNPVTSLSSVSKLPYLTRPDTFVLMSSILDFLSLIEVTITTRLADNHRADPASAIDRRCRRAFPLVFLLAPLEYFFAESK